MQSLLEKINSLVSSTFSSSEYIRFFQQYTGTATLPNHLLTDIAKAIIESEVKSPLSDRKMSEAWLSNVLTDQNTSIDGLCYLAICIDSKGYVSLPDALNWLDLQKSTSTTKPPKPSKSNISSHPAGKTTRSTLRPTSRPTKRGATPLDRHLSCRL